MESKLRKLAFFVYDNFAPLIIFLIAEHLVDLKTAIAATVAISLLDLIFRSVKKVKITRLYLFSLVVTVAFGAIDIYSSSPFLFKYESSITNILTAGFFGITLWRGKPLIQEIAEGTMDPDKAKRPDVQQYLKILTFAWTLYFLVKASVYGYVSNRYSIDEAIAFRATVGTTSLLVMIFGEQLIRRPLFRVLQQAGLIISAH